VEAGSIIHVGAPLGALNRQAQPTSSKERAMIDRNGSAFHSPALMSGSRHRRRARPVRHATTPSVTAPRRSTDTTRLLVVVTAEADRAAVLAAVTATSGTPATRQHVGHQTVHALGRIDRAEVLLARVDTKTVFSSGRAVAALVGAVGPDCVILAGTGYGLRAGEGQRLGDIVLATQLRPISHRRVISPTRRGEVVQIERDPQVYPAQGWLDRIRAAARTWHGVTVHEGPMVSEGIAIDSAGYRDLLGRAEPAAIAGETDGSGAWSTLWPAAVEWVMVKALADWGYDRDPVAHAMAAANAASFVVHAIRTGALGLPAEDPAS
jgi:nucleoside phosphorylase